MSLPVAAAYQYADDVITGNILACRYVILACKRFKNDLKNGHKRGLYFDEHAAQYALDFYDLTRHVKGELTGQAIELEAWQGFIIANLYGWKWKASGLRRFRTAYNEVARKNAKSTLSSGIGLFMTGFDGEGGPEVYSAATSKDQAKIVFGDARRMGLGSPVLKKRLEILKHDIEDEHNGGRFRALASDADNLDGLNPHCAIVDELHAHKSREVWDVLETAVGARSQPLLWAITTAGFNREGICYEIRGYVTKILEGSIQDDTTFGIIYTLDDGDDWKDSDVWLKSNPNLGVSVKPDDIARLALKAEATPTALNNFLTKRLNIWCNAATAWLNMDDWQKCPDILDDDKLSGLPCWIGVDLAQKLDLAAVVAVFLDGDEIHVKPLFYLPENSINRKQGSLGNLYKTWADAGHLKLTEGDSIDYDVIEDDIRELLSRYDVQEVCFDPWGAIQISQNLIKDNAPVVHVGMTVKNLSEPMKEFESKIVKRKFHHPRNPVLDWNASNVVAKVDANDNIFPRKETADNKIDGIVAIILGLSRALLHEPEISTSRTLSAQGIRSF